MRRLNGLFASVRGKLFLLLLITFIPMFAIQAIYTYYRFEARRANELQANLEVARAIAGVFQVFIHNVIGQELAIGIHLSSSGSLSVEAMNRILSKNKTENPALRNFSWISPQGRVIGSSMESTIGMDVSHHLFIREILSGREWFLDNLVLSRTTHKPVVAISRGIRNDAGELLGIVTATVSPDKLEEALPVKRVEGGAWSIIDAAGMLVHQHPHVDLTWDDRKLLRGHPFLKDVHQGREITTVAVFPQHEKQLMAAATPAGSLGWVIVAGRSEEEAMGPVRAQLIQHVTLFLVLTITVFLAALAISHGISDPIRKLQGYALALGQGGIKQGVEARGCTEFQELAAALNIMAGEIGVREEELQAERQRLLSVLEAIPAFVALQSPEGAIRFANHTFRETFGDTEGRRCYEAMRGRAEPCEGCAVSRVFDTHSPQQREWTSPGGRSYLIYNHPFTDIDGSPLALKLGVDITERKKAEEELRRVEGSYRSLFDNMLDGFAYCKMIFEDNQPWDYEYLAVNRAFEELTGLGNVSGRKLTEVIPGIRESNPELLEIYGRVALTGEPERFEIYVEQLGSWFFVSVYSLKVGYFYTVFDNITERKRMEAALRESEAKFRSYVEHAPLAVLVADRQGRFVDCNPAALHMLGFDAADLLGMQVPDTVLDEDREMALQGFATLIEQGHIKSEYRLKRRSGEWIWAALEAVRVTDDRFMAFCRDITERKQAQEALAESEARFRAVFHQAAVGVAEMDTLTGRFLRVNQRCADILGATIEELENTTFHAVTHPEDLQANLDNMSLLTAGKIHEFAMEKRCLRKDGTTIWVNLTVSPLCTPGETPTRHIGIVKDITARKAAEEELRSLPVRLLAAQEEERKRIAHELHDSIGGSLGAIRFSLQNALALAQGNASMSEAIEDLTAMVQQTSEEARRIYANLRPSMLDDLGVIATIGWFTRQFQEIYNGVRIEKQIQMDEEDIPESLKIVVFRIMQEALHNIAKYSKADLVRISLSGKDDSLGLQITDNGVGFDVHSAYKRREGNGGLGLTSMRERVQLSGGIFAVDSAFGEGTTVRASWDHSNLV